MTDELPEASQYTLSAAHNLYILSPSEQKTERGFMEMKTETCLDSSMWSDPTDSCFSLRARRDELPRLALSSPHPFCLPTP